MIGAQPIFLTGFMGTGKSRIGRLLAEQLQRDFYDTDQMVERRAGKSIADIFAAEGEARFRQLEHECVAEAAERTDAVVALGGGAVTRECNLELVRRRGVLVCIEADIDTILERVSRREDRPLLAGLSRHERRQRIESLLAERQPFYSRADLTIRTSDERPAEATTAALAQDLEEWFAKRSGTARD